MSLEALRNIGLTKGEIKVYEALLGLGESTKTPIANASGISPGKIYDVLERLMRKGLVSVIKKGNVKHFKVANPKHLGDYIKRKKEEIDKEEKIVENLLPELLAKYSKKKETSDAEIYVGWKGLQTIYDELVDALGKGEIDYVFGATQGTDPDKTLRFFDRFNKKRREKGIKLRIIYNEEDKTFAKKYIKSKKLDIFCSNIELPVPTTMCFKSIPNIRIAFYYSLYTLFIFCCLSFY